MKRLLPLSCLLLIHGCTVGPDYQAPENIVQEEWNSPDQETIATTDCPLSEWWEVFEDPLLSRYITLGVEYNEDILTATANVCQARALRQVVAASFYPQVGADVNATRTYFSKNGPVFAIGPSTGSLPGSLSSGTGLPFTAQAPQIQNLFNFLLDFTWEIDLFGKTRRMVEAADAMIGSAVEQRNDVLITVLGEIARNYMELRSLQKRQALVDRSVLYYEKKAELIRGQFHVGYASRLDVENILSQLSTERAKVPDLQAQIHRSIYILSVLIGCPPETLLDELLDHEPLPVLPENVAVGLKSDLLRRRPDVRRAERELAAATANIGVAVASFFPTFTLVGDGGLQSLAIEKLFSWKSKTWSYGGDMLTPIFQGGRLKGNLEAQRAQADAAYRIYQQTVLKALEEAESTLIAFTQSVATKKERHQATQSYRSLVSLSKARTKRGLTSLLDLLNAEIQLVTVEEMQLDSDTASLLNLVALYKALGGSCEM